MVATLEERESRTRLQDMHREEHLRAEKAEAKIEAALALHRLAAEPIQPVGDEPRICGCGHRWIDGSCTSPTVKALKGAA